MKSHKTPLEMRPIFHATNSYKLAKWLNQKLKPPIRNKYTIEDIFEFADEIRNKQVSPSNILLSYDVNVLFTNVPVNETIEYLVDKASSEVPQNPVPLISFPGTVLITSAC